MSYNRRAASSLRRAAALNTPCLVLSILVCRAPATGLELNPQQDQQQARAGELLWPGGTQINRDVVYCSPGGTPLTLDLYRPGGLNPRPLAIYVHGGGWHGGDKAVGADVIDFPELVGRGYVVGSINYRHAPTHRFPAQLEDVRCAIRFLRRHAAQFGIDAARMGAWGASAGGHLVALAALTASRADRASAPMADEESGSLAAVVVYYGPADLAAGDLPDRTREIIARVFGTSPADLARGSPVAHVHGAAPPFLLIHGDADISVPLSQSQALYDRLRSVGAPAELVIVRNAAHVFESTTTPIDPDRVAITTLLADFFDRTTGRGLERP